MKTYRNLWDTFISADNIKLAIHDASVGNKNRRTKHKLQKMQENLDYYIPFFQRIVENYRNAEHVPVEIYDGISRKKRTIIVPTAIEQVVHHMVVNVLKPIFMKSMYQHSYGSIPGRGGYHGMKVMRKWLPCKYILKMDIRKYFESVNQDKLIDALARKIKDSKFMEILTTIIRVVERGIPLGFYTSQWFANFILTPLDHYITSELGFGHYMRYMDDMVVCGNNKRKLHRLRVMVEKYLQDNLGLELKDNWQVFRFVYHPKRGRFLDFMGFKFYGYKTTMRKSIFYKALQKAKRMARSTPNWYTATQALSYLGWFKATDTYKAFQEHFKHYIDIKKLKKLVCRHDKYRQFNSARACGAFA